MSTSAEYPGALITEANMPTRGMWGDQPPEGMWPDEYLIRLKNEVLALQAAVGIAGQASRKGIIPLPLGTWRAIAANEIPVAAVASGSGGALSKDSAPKLDRVNAATDKKLRIEWVATGVIEITNDFVYPPDFDDDEDITVHLLANMAGATDTPVIAVGYFEGVGDADAGGNTAAVTGVDVAEYTRTILAADIAAAPNAASVTLIPAAHGTDELYIYGAWIEYSRKLAADA